MADRGQQSGAHPVRLGQRPGFGCGLGKPALLKGERGLHGERGEYPAVRGRQRASA